MDKTFKIQFDADLHINKIKGALTDLQKNLNQLKLPDSMLTSTTKDIAKLENYIKDFQSLANKTSFSTKDVDNLVKTYSKIEDLTRKLNIDTQAINGLNINKLLPPEMAQRLEQLKGLLEEVQKLIDFKDNKPKQLQVLTDELGVTEKKVDELKNKLKELNEIKEQTNKNLINNRVEQTNLKEQLKALQEKKKALEKPRGKGSKEYKDNEKELDKLEQKAQALQIKIDGLKQKLVGNPNNNSYITASTDLKGKQNELANIQTQIEALSRANEGIARRKPGTQLKEYQDLVTQINELISKLEDLKIKENEIKAAQKETGSSISSTTSELDNETEKIANLKTQIDNLNNNNLDVEKFNQIRQALADMMGVDISQIPTNLEDVKNIINQLSDEKLKAIKIALEGTAGSSQNLTEILKQLGIELGEVKDQSEQFNDQMREVSALRTRIQYFFGLNNAINLVKRAVRGAFDTIKELDKAMTETAVVTNFSVGDMWEQLPEYTKRANELGVTTLAAYEAATLYYQQGLKTNEVNALSVETLKMARIAGLDAAEATDRMTNALRGFNMELTEANAQRVDDVYSELAANTASNVDEISTAMTKVASLAHNANMEFETTAAFLAQIIETTRESAETAGTALKTVVARFSEVKKLVSEGQLIGSDEEGQTINVNRVGEALQAAGINLNKYFIGEVGLDDIFMELASKWDNLTSIQQRYIATQAAGSRQQSRFIALMSDYARTQELVGKAYNANGAAARQFAKTQESLESKLNRLKNAWNEFLMGLTNNVVVKTFVDLLTDLLNVINKVTSAFGNGTGSILKWGAAIVGILGGKALFKSGGLLDNALGAVTQNTIFGNALGKIGIGGKRTEAAPSTAPVSQVQGPPTADGKGPKGPIVFSNIADIGKKGWGLAQGLGTKVGSLFGATEMSGMAAGLAGIATALTAVGVAVGLVVAGYQAWLHLTPKGQLKQAKKIAEVMNETAANTQNAANEMKQARDQYRQYTDAVNNASNIEERNEAIQNRNEYINSLLEQNEAFAKYVSTEIKDGQLILTVNDAELDEAIKKTAEAATNAATSADLANSMQSGKQADVFEARIRRAGVNLENRTIRDYDEYGNETTRALTDAEYAKFAQYAQAAENARAEQRAYAAQGYGRQLEGSGLEDDVASMLANAMANAFDEDQYLKDINSQRSENWWNGQATLEQLRADYKDLYGIDAGDMNRGDLARAVAQGQVDREREGNLDHLAELLQGDQKDQYQALLEAFQGTGKMAEINLEGQSFEEILDQLGFNDLTKEQIDDFATALGTTTDKLGEHIAAVVEDTKKIQQQKRADVFKTMMRAGMTITTADQERINGMTPEQISQINETATAAEGLLSTEDYQGLISNLIKGTISQEFASELTTLFNSIDLSNPIGAFNELAAAKEEASKAGNQGLVDYIEKIQSANEELFTASNLVQSFIVSNDYDEITESLDNFIEENERISADNIKELAKESKLLKQLLDSDTVSTKALANALTLIQEGKIGFEQLTDAMLKALNVGTSFEEMMEEVSKWIEDFDSGTDLKEGTEHIIEQLENLKEYVSNWEFGNEPTKNIYEHIFGKGTYDQLVDQFGNDFEAFEAFINDKIGQYSHMAENAGLGGIQAATAAGVTGLKEIDGSGGQFFEWDLSQFSSTTEAIDSIASALGVTQEAAEAFILSWQTHMPKLRTEWDQLNYQTQLETYIQNLDDARIVTEQELIALGAAVNENGHISQEALQDVIDKINEIRTKAGKDPIEIPVIVNWQDESGNSLTGDDLLNQYKEQFGSDKAITITRPLIYEGSYEGSRSYQGIDDAFSDLQQYIDAQTNSIDIDGIFENLTSKGLSSAQAEEIASEFASQLDGALLNKKIEIPIQMDDGSVEMVEEVVTGADLSALEANINAKLEAANAQLVANNLANANYSGLTNSVSSAVGNGVVNGATTGWNNFLEGLAKAGPINVPIAFNGVTQGGATGGIVRSLAEGTSTRFLQPGFALTGEEGPEIIWNKERGYAYITGQNGAEFQNLQPGDRVFNAAETQRILHNSNFAKDSYFDSYASGGWKPPGDGGGGGGSDSDYKKESTWRNELDWLYDLMEDIAELERRQEIIQSRYDIYLKDVTKTGRDLYNLTKAELTNLQTQLQGQQTAQIKRLQQMGELMQQYPQYKDYVKWNDKDKTLEINWDKIEGIQDKDTYDAVTDLVSRAETIQDQMDDAERSIWDIRKQIQDLQNRYLQQYLDFQNRVLEAVVQQYQDTIDNLSELNDTLNDTNRSILESIQREIDLERQIRDNTNTENQIAEMEARLAYLQRDTTGANASEIRALQKQLDEARENYNDTLVDQAVERLSQANDDAAVQREKQIELMQAQLDYWKESGGLWDEVISLIAEGFTGDGTLIQGSRLEEVLKNAEGYEAMSQAQRDNWANELILETNEVGAHLIQLNEGLKISTETIRAILLRLEGKMGGTPEHSYTAEKTEEKYATGGLNTYTGWAHLDGTPSEPEYVLNARQTDAFLRLADILPAAMNGTAPLTNNYGGNIYLDLNMHVDEIANDYDVDRIADRVKEIIYDAGSYRNVNTLNFIR